MKATIITDNEFHSELFLGLKEKTIEFLRGKEFNYETIDVDKSDLTFCMGCFSCWIKKPGECVINDLMTRVNRSFVNSDLVIYLSPILFGQFSANIKNTLDRWIPNILPFFITRADGSTMHPSRYDSNPKQVIIGYGDDLPEEEVKLFIDITKNHKGNVDVLIFRNVSDDIIAEMSGVDFMKTGRVI